MKPWCAAAAMAVVLVGACGRPDGGGGTVPPLTPPTEALAAWEGFPAASMPRPIVWLGNYSPQGFTTDFGKLAAMCSRFALGTPLPKNLPSRAVATWANGATYGYQGISAADAFVAMSRADPGMPSSGCDSVNPIVINGARLGTFGFETDRGKAQMTAW